MKVVACNWFIHSNKTLLSWEQMSNLKQKEENCLSTTDKSKLNVRPFIKYNILLSTIQAAEWHKTRMLLIKEGLLSLLSSRTGFLRHGRLLTIGSNMEEEHRHASNLCPFDPCCCHIVSHCETNETALQGHVVQNEELCFREGSVVWHRSQCQFFKNKNSDVRIFYNWKPWCSSCFTLVK